MKGKSEDHLQEERITSLSEAPGLGACRKTRYGKDSFLKRSAKIANPAKSD
jgi:hypothetical protein